MASDATHSTLEEAYALIEEDRLEEAQALLKPILAEDPDNVDAWWLYVYAVKDVETARMALNTVLKLDPNYPGAQELLASLEERFPAQPVPAAAAPGEIKRLSPPATLPDLPEDDEIDDPLGIDQELVSEDVDVASEERILEEEISPPRPAPARRVNPLWLAIGALAAVFLLAVLVLLSGNQGRQVAPTPTTVGQAAATITSAADVTEAVTESTGAVAVAEQATAEAVIETEAAGVVTEETGLPTEEPSTQIAQTEAATLEATDGSAGALIVSTPVSESAVEAVQAALAEFELVEGSVDAQETLLGSTLLADVCTVSGEELRETLYGAMRAIAAASASLNTEAQAVGVRLVNCTTGEVLRVIATPLEDAAAFAAGSLDEATFQARWLAVA